MEQISLRLPKSLRHKLRLRALKSHQPESTVIRDLLERGLSDEQPPATHPLMQLADLHLHGGPTDLSTRADDYLYGDQ